MDPDALVSNTSSDVLLTELDARERLVGTPADPDVEDVFFDPSINTIARCLSAAFVSRETKLPPDFPEMLKFLFPSAKVLCLGVQEDGGRLIARAATTDRTFHRFSVVPVHRTAMGRAIMGRRMRRFDITRSPEFEDMQDLNACYGCLSMLCAPILSEEEFPASEKAAKMDATSSGPASEKAARMDATFAGPASEKDAKVGTTFSGPASEKAAKMGATLSAPVSEKPAKKDVTSFAPASEKAAKQDVTFSAPASEKAAKMGSTFAGPASQKAAKKVVTSYASASEKAAKMGFTPSGPESEEAAKMAATSSGLTAVVTVGYAVRMQDISLRDVDCLSQIAAAVAAELHENEEAVDRNVREMWKPLLMPAVPKNRRRQQRAQAFAQHWFWLFFTNKWIEAEFRRFAADRSMLVDRSWSLVALLACILFTTLPGESSCRAYRVLKAGFGYLAPLLYISFNRTGYVRRREVLILGGHLSSILLTAFGPFNLLGVNVGGGTCGTWMFSNDGNDVLHDVRLRNSMMMLQLAVTSIFLSVRMWLFIPVQFICLVVVNSTLPRFCEGLDASGSTAECVRSLQFTQLLPFGLLLPWACAYLSERHARMAFRAERLKEE